MAGARIAPDNGGRANRAPGTKTRAPGVAEAARALYHGASQARAARGAQAPRATPAAPETQTRRTMARQRVLQGLLLAGLAGLPALAAARARAQAAAEPAPAREVTPFDLALEGAERALESKELGRARELLDRAVERDARNAALWDLWARWARAAGDADEELYARHRELELARAQGAEPAALDAKWAALVAIDPLAPAIGALRSEFVAELDELAARYEKEGRRHSAIGVHNEILALDPERVASKDAIARLAAAPDPSLAEFATPPDLFADVSEAWIDAFDSEHASWDERAKLERENYVTHTNAGYRVLLLCAEAMEQMNAFYREFFEYGTEQHGGSVPRIELHIFAKREEYLKLGSGPPVEWSGGQFTGATVETYASGGSPTEMFGTLFHEAAHQFVGLATNAAGWLNEGLASFFEGSRILPNGTVVTNEPADHRLAPLAARMQRGWMSSWDDGLDAKDPSVEPQRAPTFRILVGNEYPWGPAWYAPTWGIVYFLYNYQDPVDGRFVYRQAFREFVQSSGGRMGEGAVENFEEVVLAAPAPRLKGLDWPADAVAIELPETVEQLDAVWKDWILRLQRERLGQEAVERPYLQWGRFAAAAKDWTTAKEHFEKGLVASPRDPAVRVAFAQLLHEQLDSSDRAARLLGEALALYEEAPEPDEGAIAAAEALLAKADPGRESLEDLRAKLLAGVRQVVDDYAAADRPKMVMHLAWRFGADLGDAELFERYAEAVRASGKSLLLWQLAYDESSLAGWSLLGNDESFTPDGVHLGAELGEYAADDFSYRYLTLQQLTAGDYSLEATLQAERGQVNFAGLVFGRKGTSDLHAAIYFPGKPGTQNSTLDLASFYEDGSTKTWRHVQVPAVEKSSDTASVPYRTIRIDVAERFCDLWLDGVWQGTQEFPSADVLRGSIGLIVGPGRARFRDVRFRSSPQRDPSARLERDVRLERARAAGPPAGGSYLGAVPPWVRARRFAQGSRSSFAEHGLVPQLLVFWSIAQNEVVPIDGWLRELAAQFAPAGLEVLSVCSPNDDEAVEAYLAEHPFPGAVAVDEREGEGIGDTFALYGIDRFFLPRVLLLDVDQTVVWEGEPGFEQVAPWKPGMESFVDLPLRELVAARRLVELGRWSAAWDELGGRSALAAGRAGELRALLEEAGSFDRVLSREAGWAAQQHGVLCAALDDFAATVAAISAAEAEPALAVLLEWAEAYERAPAAAQLRKHAKAFDSRRVKQWATTLKACERARGGSLDEAAVAEFLESSSRMTGLFPEGLRADVEAARAAGDWARAGELLEQAPARPALWLAREHFGWQPAN